MLRELWVRNFKSWREFNIEFRPITLLYGANSSGKSSILQFLLMLKQTKDSNDNHVAVDFAGPLVDLGSYRDAIYAHEEKRSINWSLRWSLNEEVTIPDPAKPKTNLARDDEIQVEVELAIRSRQVSMTSLSYDFGGSSFYIYKKAGKPKYQLEALDDNGFRFVRSLGRAWDLPPPTRGYSFPDQAQTYFKNAQFLRIFETSYVEQLDKLFYLGPLRENPRRQYTWSGSNPSDVGPKGERAIEAILAAQARDEWRNVKKKSHLKSFQEIVAWWLKEIGLINSFEVREVSEGSSLYRVFVKKTPKSAETLITDVGFGVSQILPVIALLYYAPPGSTVLIEQPEIHLHPAVQAGLADLFISVSQTRRIQLIVESHSEHLLTRLMRRVAEGDTPYGNIQHDHIAAYFCHNRQGTSSLEELRVNLYGAIENWPKDFFGDQMGEVFAREQAAIKRRLEKN